MAPGFAQHSDLIAGTTYHVFGHLYKTGATSANYNRFDAWIDPTAEEMRTLAGADTSMAITAGSVSSFNTIGFRTANLDAGDLMRIDSLKVSVVPEPSSIALLGLALLGMAGIRRGKRG